MALGAQIGQRIGAFADPLGDSGLGPEPAGKALGIDVHVTRDQRVVRRHRQRHRQRAVAGEGAQLQDLARAGQFHQQRQELADFGR